MEKRLVKNNHSYYNNKDTDLPVEVYQVKIPKMPYPDRLYLHVGEKYGEKRMGIDHIEYDEG